MSMINVTIENCNSIDHGVITIKKSALNVKYGINGTGKSTLAKAIQYCVSTPESLQVLKQFKHLENNSLEAAPKVSGLDGIESMMIFDEEFIEKFTFKKDEVLENSFDIFIEDDTFNTQTAEIEQFVKGVREEVEKNSELEKMSQDLRRLSDSFGKKATEKGISKASAFSKSLADGNKLHNIPQEVSQYTSFLKSQSNTKWISWQSQGTEFLDIDECCPFCASEIADKKDDVKKITETYKPKNFEHLIVILNAVESLGDYFNIDTKDKIIQITTNKTGISSEEELTLKQIKEQIDLLLSKIQDLKSLSYFSFNENIKVDETLLKLKINLELIPHLNSERTNEVTRGVNESLEQIIRRVQELQVSVGKNKTHISKLINKYKIEINQFLEKAGYKYKVFFDNKTPSSPMKLKHLDTEQFILDGKKHLSYGEKNAFAMLLFMYQCLSSKPDLIVLDDPISSFDKNKKYAIMRKLFVENTSLKGLTVLMLTHDFDPIVDFFKIIPVNNINKAHLIYNKNGYLKEISIEKEDILTFIEVCDLNTGRTLHPIIKLIYIRRKLDAMNNKNSTYNLISNLIHKRDVPIYKDGTPMLQDDIDIATNEIEKIIENFDYNEIVKTIQSNERMIALYKIAENDYEKLQIFRILTSGVNLENNYLQKYINEVFHIENDNISQLDPNKYSLVPEFVINECNRYVEEISKQHH